MTLLHQPLIPIISISLSGGFYLRNTITDKYSYPEPKKRLIKEQGPDAYGYRGNTSYTLQCMGNVIFVCVLNLNHILSFTFSSATKSPSFMIFQENGPLVE